MEKNYKFLALIISCALAGATPITALCSETASTGETAEASETAAELEPGTEELEKEVVGELSVSSAGHGEYSAGYEEQEGAFSVTEGYCGVELTWEYREGVLYIKGTGEMYDYDEDIRPEWHDYADQIVELHIGKGITLIDGDAFEGLLELNTIYFGGNEIEWKELSYEIAGGDQNPESVHEEDYVGTVGEDGMEEVFAGVTEYYFQEEPPEAAETLEGTREESEIKEVESGVAMAVVGSLQIVTQPKDAAATEGGTVILHVEVNKDEVTYRWQRSTNGRTWRNCISSGYNTDTMRFKMRERYGGRLYRCVVTAGNEQVISEPATVTYIEPLVIMTQPEDVVAAEGAAVNFHVEVNKDGVTYKWQRSTNGRTWRDCVSSGYNTDTMNFEMMETYGGRLYRCIITDGTQSVTTRAAKLTFDAPEIVIEGVVYKLIDGMMTVIDYRGSADEVVVEEFVEGHTVTVIGESAFEGSSIKSIDLPNTIRQIQKRAFADCSNLTRLNYGGRK